MRGLPIGEPGVCQFRASRSLRSGLRCVRAMGALRTAAAGTGSIMVIFQNPGLSQMRQAHPVAAALEGKQKAHAGLIRMISYHDKLFRISKSLCVKAGEK